MYSKELEDLIEAIVADGKITDKERAVISKRAEKEGVDLDELEVYLQGKVDKQHRVSQSVQNERVHNNTEKGNVKRHRGGGNFILIGLCLLLICLVQLIPPSKSYDSKRRPDSEKVLGLLQSQSQLASTEIQYRKICKFNDYKPLKWGRRICVYPLDITANYGIQLSKMTCNDIQFNDDSTVVTIHLPEPVMISSGYEPKINKEDIVNLRSRARLPVNDEEIQKMANMGYTDFCEKADSLLKHNMSSIEENTKLIITSMLKSVGFSEVVFN